MVRNLSSSMTTTNTDTIAALATAPSSGAIAIIRISGPDAYSVALSLTNQPVLKPRYATLCSVYEEGVRIDQAIVIYFKAPHSFTGEEVVEIQTHGGLQIVNMILEELSHNGVRLAQPGEFSKRAVLNGRMDLSEAEAVAALIDAQSSVAVKALARQLKGGLGEFVTQHREALIRLLAYCEVSIDYAEEDLPPTIVAQMQEQLSHAISALEQTITYSKLRKGVMQGVRIAIVGKPNVGKSSLLNALLQYERAIVSDVAGTTRDTIEEQVHINGQLLRFIDTAGIREGNEAIKSIERIERIGIERSKQAASEADMLIAMFDGSMPLDEEDATILALLEEYSQKEVIILLNKSDKRQQFDERLLPEGKTVLHLSVQDDINALLEQLKERLHSELSDQETLLISTRQIGLCQEAMQALMLARSELDNGVLELFAFEVNRAINALSALGKPYEIDQMFDEMFSSFCLGK